MLRIVVDPSSFAEAAGGTVAGRLHIESDDLCFPDDDWWDFPLVVLGWWLTAIRSAGGDDFELRFMDGPFRVDCSRAADRVQFVFVRDGAAGDIEVGSGISTSADLSAEIEAAATAALSYCLGASLPTGGLERLVGLPPE